MSAENTVYRHVKRDEWGLAIVVEELEDRTTYLFEGVGTKTLGGDYLHMVVPADLDPDESDTVFKRLAKKRPRTAASLGRTPPPVKKPALTFEQQIGRFLVAFPGGFEDPAFIKDERGGETSNRQKAIVKAGAELSGATMKEASPAEVFETINSLMQLSKKVVTASDLKKVAAIADDKHGALAQALKELLHGEEAYHGRFNGWVRALKVKPRPSWPMATLLPALFSPSEHVLVKPAHFRVQAAILDMDGRSATTPDGKAYESALEVAKRVGTMLTAAGHAPQDLWDVYAFISKTAKVAKAAPAPAPTE